MNIDKHSIIINFDAESKTLSFSYCDNSVTELSVSASQLFKIIDIDIPDLSDENKTEFEKVIGSTVLSILNSFASDQIDLGNHNELLINEAYEVIKKRAASGDAKAQYLMDRKKNS